MGRERHGRGHPSCQRRQRRRNPSATARGVTVAEGLTSATSISKTFSPATSPSAAQNSPTCSVVVRSASFGMGNVLPLSRMAHTKLWAINVPCNLPVPGCKSLSSGNGRTPRMCHNMASGRRGCRRWYGRRGWLQIERLALVHPHNLKLHVALAFPRPLVRHSSDQGTRSSGIASDRCKPRCFKPFHSDAVVLSQGNRFGGTASGGFPTNFGAAAKNAGNRCSRIANPQADLAVSAGHGRSGRANAERPASDVRRRNRNAILVLLPIVRRWRAPQPKAPIRP